MNDLIELEAAHAPEIAVESIAAEEEASAESPDVIAVEDVTAVEMEPIVEAEALSADDATAAEPEMASSDDDLALAADEAGIGEESDADDDEGAVSDEAADAFVMGDDAPVFDDEFPIIADAGAEDDDDDEASDPRLDEMLDVLVTLRDSEVGHSLRLLRQRFPHIPFPFRVRALMAVRHGAAVG